MAQAQAKTAKRARRHGRIRARVSGTAERPRLAVYRSNRFVYAQLINDERSVTIAAADSRHAKGTSMRDKARAVGAAVATQAKNVGITAAVFDRGGFLYAGAIRDLADGAREAALTF